MAIPPQKQTVTSPDNEQEHFILLGSNLSLGVKPSGEQPFGW